MPPLFNLAHLATPSANAALPSHPRLLFIFSFCTLTAASCSWLFLYTSCFLSPPNSLRALQRMLAVSEPGALNYYTLFCLILLTLSVSKNPTSTHLPLTGSLDSLLCNLIAPTAEVWHSFSDATHASGGVIIFVSLSFSEFSTSSLSSLDPYPDCVGVNISLNNSSSLSSLNVYAPPIRSSQTDGRTDSFAPSIFSSSRSLFVLVDFNCHHPPLGLKRYFRPTWGGSIQLGHLLWLFSLNEPDTPLSIGPLVVAFPTTLSLLSPLLPSLAPGRCFRT